MYVAWDCKTAKEKYQNKQFEKLRMKLGRRQKSQNETKNKTM